MFDLFLINFGYVCGSYKTLDQAIKMGKKTGFQFSVYENFPNKLGFPKMSEIGLYLATCDEYRPLESLDKFPLSKSSSYWNAQ